MMLSHLNRFANAVTITALTLGALVQQPVQKASAQIVGAGSSSITTLANYIRANDARFTGSRYVVTGSGAGRNAFMPAQTNFVATDGNFGIIDVNQNLILQQAIINLGFGYNVPGYNGEVLLGTTPKFLGLTTAQVCQILAGTLTNWNQVAITSVDGNGNSLDAFGNIVPTGDPTTDVNPGPDLPIRRVVRGDNSGATTILNTGLINQVCLPAGLALRLMNPPATFDRSGNLTNDLLQNPSLNDIIVPPAFPDPFTTGNDNNPDSYTLGLLRNIAATPGAIGYGEITVLNAFAVDPTVFTTIDPTGQFATIPTVANVNPTATSTYTFSTGGAFLAFRRIRNIDSTAALQQACLAFTDTNNILAAGFSPSQVGPGAVAGGNPRCLTDIKP